MLLVKGGSSFEIHKRREQRLNIWQSGFQDWTIRDSTDFEAKAQYIRMNPVQGKLVAKPEEWPYGSAHGDFAPDEMPEQLQGLKPPKAAGGNVGAKAPTP